MAYGTFSIYDFIFYDILKFPPMTPILNGELQHDFVFGLFVPSLILVMFLYFSLGPLFGQEHAGIRKLVMLAGFMVALTLGWYPIIAGLGNLLFVLVMGFGLLYFILRRFFSEEAEIFIGRGLNKGAGLLADKINQGAPITISGKNKRELESELRKLDEFYINTHEMLRSINEGKMKEVKIDPNSLLNACGGCITNARVLIEQLPLKDRKPAINKCTTGSFQKELKNLFGYK